MNIDAKPVHVLNPAIDVSALENRGVDPAFQFFIVEIRHAAVRVRFFEYNRAVAPPDLVDIRFWKQVSLKINDHVNFTR
jgi:hypothetical protein